MDRNIIFIRVIKNCFYKPIFVHNDLYLYTLINAQFTATIFSIGRVFLSGFLQALKNTLLASFLLACKRELLLRFVANRRRELEGEAYVEAIVGRSRFSTKRCSFFGSFLIILAILLNRDFSTDNQIKIGIDAKNVAEHIFLS